MDIFQFSFYYAHHMSTIEEGWSVLMIISTKYGTVWGHGLVEIKR